MIAACSAGNKSSYVPLKVCLQVIHTQKRHISKYCSKNCIVNVRQKQNGIWQKIISHHEISTGKLVRTHLWAINIKMPEKRNVFLYHSPCLPQRQSLAIRRAADGLKKRCKEIAGQANSCQRENPIVRGTSPRKNTAGEKGASVRSRFASCFWAGKTLNLDQTGTTKLSWETRV